MLSTSALLLVGFGLIDASFASLDHSGNVLARNQHHHALRDALDLTEVHGSQAKLEKRAKSKAKSKKTKAKKTKVVTPAFSLVHESIGSSFFDKWDFYTAADPTHGYVNYVSAATAASANLTGLQTNSLSNSKYVAASKAPQTAVIRVDATTQLKSGANRNSVRISTKQAFSYGLFILDAVKMPYGCAVWPAFWTLGTGVAWPNGGEIDIVEGVNANSQNQMTLHTSNGCSLSKNMGNGASGTVLSKNCYALTNSNIGCGVQDKSTSSYGAGFNANGGGVFAMQWSSAGVSIWRFPRSSIPSDISSKAPNPAKWGKPVAFFNSKTCPGSHFTKQQIIIDTTLCGDWAGATYSSAGCGGTCASAVMDPANFKNAFWEIASVRVYQQS